MIHRQAVVARILLVDGVLLLLLAFLHLFGTPLIEKWFTGEITRETLTSASPFFLLNHMTMGMLLIPFGISTLYTASGVRAGLPWARAVAVVNALSVLILPLIVGAVMGVQNFNGTVFLGAAIIVTLIGISMFIPLLWLHHPRSGR